MQKYFCTGCDTTLSTIIVATCRTTIRLHCYAQHKMETIVTVVCSAYMLETIMNCGITAEPIEMLRGMWTHGGPRNDVLAGDPNTPQEEHFWGVIVWYVRTFMIISTLCARRWEWCGLWLPLYCSNLLCVESNMEVDDECQKKFEVWTQQERCASCNFLLLASETWQRFSYRTTD